MILRRRRIIELVLSMATVAVAVAACSGEPGKAVPQSPPAASSSSHSAGSSRRPREIDLTGVDACRVLSTDQAMQLNYDKGYQRSPQPGTDDITGAPNCSYSSRSRGLGVLVSAVTSEGTGAWLNNPERETTIPPKPIVVAGFPGLQITVPPSEPLPDKCYVLVDVHDGQYLEVFASQLLSSGPTGSATYCKEATRVAEMALATIESS